MMDHTVKVNGTAHRSPRDGPNAVPTRRPNLAATSKLVRKGDVVTILQELATTWYLRTRIYAQTRLQAWGRLVATRQITVLMLCSVFLCALMYPVLSLYAWAAPSTGSDFFGFLRTSPTWSLMATYDGKSVAPTARDLHLPWQDMDGVVVNIEEACWQRIPKFREITVQQVLIGLPFDQSSASEHGILDRRALHTLHKVESDLQALLMADSQAVSLMAGTSEEPLQNLKCASIIHQRRVSQQDSPSCFTLSPMEYWNHDEGTMLSDSSLIATVNAAHSGALHFPIRHDNLFVNRVHSGETMRKADYGVITIFLTGSPSRADIVKLVSSVGVQHGLQLSSRNPAPAQQAVLKHFSKVSTRSQTGANAVFILAYVVVGFYIYLTLRCMDRVHSRTGLVLTGIVQMLVSGMASISLCALASYKINLVPWKLIPFLIVVLGVDNMFVLVQSVTETSVNLPVKERIAQGLGQSGTSIFVNMIAELFALYLLYTAIPTRVIREMVVFGAVALVMDYAMQMTYFVTVLSIDMQRLELADLISQGSGTLRKPRTSFRSPPEPIYACPHFFDSVVAWLRHRKARSYAAIGLIATNLFFYFLYGGDYFVPAFCSNVGATNSNPYIPSVPSASDAFWQVLGSSSAQAMHVHIASPLVLHFSASPAVATLAAISFSAWAVTKYVVLPISFTTFALYLLLLHLLKGSEQLNSEDFINSANTLTPVVTLQTSVCIVASSTFHPMQRDDLVLCAYDDTGSIAASWTPTRGGIAIQHLSDADERQNFIQYRLEPSEGIACIELSSSGEYCAAISTKGRLCVWRTRDADRPLSLKNAATNVHAISFCQLGRFQSKPAHRPNSGDISHADSSSAQEQLCLNAVGLNGALYAIFPQSRACEVIAAPAACSRPALLSPSDGRVVMYFCRQLLGTQSLEIWQEGEAFDWMHIRSIDLGKKLDPVTTTRFLTTQIHEVVAIGWIDGTVSVFDIKSGARITHCGETSQSVQQIRLVDPSGSRCHTCGHSYGHSVILAAASLSTLTISRLTPANSDICDCGAGSPMFSPARSTANLALPIGAAASRSSVDDSRLSSSTATSYPLSPHALRRLSQTNDKRRAVEVAQRLASSVQAAAESESGSKLSRGDDMAANHLVRPSLASWRKQAIGSMRLDDRGRWDACDGKLVGVRRVRTASAQTRLQGWELFCLPLKKLSGSADIAYDLTTQNLADCIFIPEAAGSKPTKAFTSKAQLPFDRVRLFRAMPDNTSIGAAFGNLHVLLTPVSTSPAPSTLCMSRVGSRTIPH